MSIGRITIYFDDLKTPWMQTGDKTFTTGRLGIGSFNDINDFTAVQIYGRWPE